jgi:hypothetical protein
MSSFEDLPNPGRNIVLAANQLNRALASDTLQPTDARSAANYVAPSVDGVISHAATKSIDDRTLDAIVTELYRYLSILSRVLRMPEKLGDELKMLKEHQTRTLEQANQLLSFLPKKNLGPSPR